MSERYRELQQYLPGLTADMPESYAKLAEVFQHQVFELHRHDDTEERTDFYIPYMMNDALECYLILKNCRMMGEYLTPEELAAWKEEGEEIRIEGCLAESGTDHALIVKQGGLNVFTLWFQDMEEVLKCYRYYRIGHFWVEGQEQWRQLVYMVGTIHDKYQYMGRKVCNKKEAALRHLMECPMFRRWSPINDSLDGVYPTTDRGTERLQELAEEAGDKKLAKMLRFYLKFPYKWVENYICKKMLHPDRIPLYHLIYEKLKEASIEYGPRNYGKALNSEIQAKRKEVHQTLIRSGFHGKYPIYYKEEERTRTEILVTEEHPFTILEWKDFHFRMQYMVSTYRIKKQKEDSEGFDCKWIEQTFNSGFFKGRNRKGFIANDLSFLA